MQSANFAITTLPLPQTPAMSSEDVLRHVILDVVHRATHLLKGHRATHQRALEQAIYSPAPKGPGPLGADAPDANAGTAMSESARTFHTVPPTSGLNAVSDLFAVGDAPIIQASSITDTLAAFVVRAVVMDPRNGYQLDQEFSKHEVERLISVCVMCVCGLPII
jgi:hypothetical protein